MRKIFKIVDDKAILQDGTVRPEPSRHPLNNIKIAARQAAWDEDCIYKVDRCLNLCCSECAANGCQLFPHEGNVFEGDPFRAGNGENLVALTRNITASLLRIKSAVEGKRFPLTDEKQVQLQVEALFKLIGFEFKREHHFDKKDIVDFFFPIEGIALEVKIKGSAMAIYRQLKRYAKQPQVKEIILLTAKPMTLPDMIEEKPANFINIAKAWL